VGTQAGPEAWAPLVPQVRAARPGKLVTQDLRGALAAQELQDFLAVVDRQGPVDRQGRVEPPEPLGYREAPEAQGLRVSVARAEGAARLVLVVPRAQVDPLVTLEEPGTLE
jgi:hypothetical protein